LFLIRVAVFIILLFLIEFYFLKKLIKSFKVFTGSSLLTFKRRLLISSLVFINLYPLFLVCAWTFSDLTGTPVLVPQNIFFDFLLIYPFWIFTFIEVQNILLFLLIEIFKLLLFPLFKKFKPRLIRSEAGIILLLVMAFIVYVPARCIHDYYAVEIRHVVYKKPALPDALNNFKIAFISDIHADRYTNKKRLENYISKVNAQHPDLVLIGGDFISSTPDYINLAAAEIGKIKSKYGIYSCVGDHDNWAYHDDYQRSLNQIMAALKEHNIYMNDNTDLKLSLNNVPALITFTTDTYVRRIAKAKLDSLVNDTNKYGLKIFLTHQAGKYLIDTAEAHGYDLFLGGHTHGGQITFLFPFKNLSPTLLETKYVRGDFHFGKMLMIVTRGLGMSLVLLRYNSTPEITVIKLLTE